MGVYCDRRRRHLILWSFVILLMGAMTVIIAMLSWNSTHHTSADINKGIQVRGVVVVVVVVSGGLLWCQGW